MYSKKVNNCFLKSILLIFGLINTFIVTGQSGKQYPELLTKFKDYQIIEFDSKEVFSRIQRSANLENFTIKLNNGAEWKLDLKNSGIIGDKYQITSAEEDGLKVSYGTKAIPTKGTINGMSNSEVSLTFNDNFIYGFLRFGGEQYFIEPVYHMLDVRSKDEFVLYNTKDIIENREYKCGYELDIAEENRVRNNTEKNVGQRQVGECFLINYNTASDWSMRVKYGSISGVENHNIGVLNDVQTNYDNEFADEIQFQMNQQWISSCATCDPWTSSTDAGTLLNSFRNWATNGGFSVDHDLAGLWTNRDLNDGTVGIAYLGVLCSSFKYHVMQDFTSSGNFLRVMVAHEIGHNFNAEHDAPGSGFIMAPSVNNTNTWSSFSISSIQTEYNNASCLQNCPGGGNFPVADFTFNVISTCLPGQVQYFDQSSNSNSRQWSFPGGTPSTSSAANPIVTYNSLGTYEATLTAFNSSGNSNALTINNIITVIDFPSADFIVEVNGRVITCFYTGSTSSSYFWEFGDGATSSFENPSHTYLNDGTYTVTLTVDNDCGFDSKTQTIEIITPPVANFTASVVSGCQPLTVNYTNQSSNNATSFLWTFPGGIPSTSTEMNPTVTYEDNGIFNVTLTANNLIGNNTNIKNNYITVSPLPLSGFNLSTNDATVVFTNSSQYATSYIWDFGDGQTSTLENPTHTYSNNGSFNVVLQSINDCGTVESSQTIIVALAPIASFTSSAFTTLCTNETIAYQSTSTYGPASFEWSFEGGTPSTSTEPNPSITYNQAGIFDVQLIVTNSNGSDTLNIQNFVSVNEQPQVSFSHLGDGLTVAFNGTIINGSNITWDFGDGQSSSEQSIEHTYEAEGTYTVTLSAENECGVVTATQDILVQLLPVAGFSANKTTACNGSEIVFTSQSSPSVTSWSWTFEGGTPSTSNQQNPIINYTTPGTYNVSLVVTNPTGDGSITLTDYITIITVPTTGFQPINDSNLVTLTNSGLGANSTSWTISGQGLDLDLMGNSVTFIAPANGQYLITQVNSNECGESIALIKTLDVNVYPKSGFSPSGELNCVNAPITFTNQSENANTYEWTFADGMPSSSTDSSPSVTFAEAGLYPVRLIVGNDLGQDSFTMMISILPLPTAEFDKTQNDGQVSFQFTGENAETYNWSFGDGNTSEISDPDHTYSNGGQYEVILITKNVCGQDTASQVLTVIISSVDNTALDAKITVTPNPNNGFFNINFNDSKETYHVVLMDIYGRNIDKMILQNDTNSTSTTQIDVTHLPAATYILRIAGKEGVATKQIVIQK
jgi:PKD repeat protein